jgi:hypothetical protein
MENSGFKWNLKQISCRCCETTNKVQCQTHLGNLKLRIRWIRGGIWNRKLSEKYNSSALSKLCLGFPFRIEERGCNLIEICQINWIIA